MNLGELEEEDAQLAGVHHAEVEDEWLHLERPRVTGTLEVWDTTDEDVNNDFQLRADATGLYHEIGDDNNQTGVIIRWILVFLCLWSSYCYVSDVALDILIKFIAVVFQCLSTTCPALACIAMAFPKSLVLLKKQLGMEKDDFQKFVVCPKCHSLYNFEDCFYEYLGIMVIQKCSHIEMENHRQEFRRTKCGEPLLKEVVLKKGVKRFYPYKVYCYKSIIENVKQFLQRPKFMVKCELWRQRQIPNGFFADVFDGQIWKDFMFVDQEPFLASPNNYALMLNVDWFQPFKHSVYSVGAIYMVFMNLPREERFKPENVMLVGIIPGPHEPRLIINSYLRPLVNELNKLWEGIELNTPSGAQVVRAALLCVGCDIPAARKVCGFTGCSSCHGCSKCTKVFPGSVGDEKMDFSGFERCTPRTNGEHRRQAEEILQQTTLGDRARKESQYGTRFTELMMLPYFDCVRMHIVDPMHNLFTGTAKNTMKIWLDPSSPTIDPKIMQKIQAKVDKVNVPAVVGRLPKKIGNSYGGFTADQWKSWTVIYSIFCLWDVLPQQDLEVWRHFVMACSILCSPVITCGKAEVGQLHLLQFCKDFQRLYGKDKVTPNMHLHLHILDCILDFGPVYSFWLFSFERFNGILGEYRTNQRSVEIQIMRKFLEAQFIKTLPLPLSFRDVFEPVISKLRSSARGTLQLYSTGAENVDGTCNISSCLFKQIRLSFGPPKKGLEWAISDEQINFYTFLGPISKYFIDSYSLTFLKESYGMFLDNAARNVNGNCERYAGIAFAGDTFGVHETRQERSSFILASWCGRGGRINTSGGNLRPGIILHFFKQHVDIGGKQYTFLIANVKWFKEHPSRHLLGAPVEVFCKDIFEDDGPANYLPMQRIHSKFVPAFEIVNNEKVLVVCPLTRKMQC